MPLPRDAPLITAVSWLALAVGVGLLVLWGISVAVALVQGLLALVRWLV